MALRRFVCHPTAAARYTAACAVRQLPNLDHLGQTVHPSFPCWHDGFLRPETLRGLGRQAGDSAHPPIPLPPSLVISIHLSISPLPPRSRDMAAKDLIALARATQD